MTDGVMRSRHKIKINEQGKSPYKAQPSRAPPLLLQPVRPVQIPSQPQPQLKISTQSVPLPTVFQSHGSRSAPQHQPQSNQATAPGPQSPTSHHLQHHDEDSVVASWNNS